MHFEHATTPPFAGRIEVVVLAASAGGIRALNTVLRGLPSAFPVPIIIVQHRGAGSTVELANAIGRNTTFLVKDADEGERMRRQVVYLAPANRHLVLAHDGSFAHSDGPKVKFSRPSADVLFASVAQRFGSGVLGVILTGADGDGADGAREIKARGGQVIAQDLESAEFVGMPWSAMAAHSVDFIVPLEKIGATIVALLSELPRRPHHGSSSPL